MSGKKTFPKNFLWGVAYASHQVEGNNKNNDWWEWEQKGKTKDKSGWACDSWNRYPVDHQLAEELGCGGFRISLEWSRIEPKEGQFSKEAIEHYRKVLIDQKNRGMKRVVTLWHWPLPLWLVHDHGGWHKKETIDFFVKYCEKVIKELGDEIDIFLTMNEPRIPLNKGYLEGEFPPGKKNPWAFFKARKNMIKAHRKCYDKAKSINKKLPVGITQYCNDFDYLGPIDWLKRLVEKAENKYNFYFFNQIEGKQDFIGFNYYTTFEVKTKKPFLKNRKKKNKASDLEWGIWPEGIGEISLDIWKRFKKPIYIFENGLADAKDTRRQEFIHDHLHHLHRSIQKGADIRGYFHWSLLDNFEWALGYGPRFGLVEMDFKTMERKPRKSFYYYQKIIKNNGIK